MNPPYGTGKGQLVLFALYSLSFTGTLPAVDSAPLNLVVIQTDEHHFNTLGCYGGEIVGTPNIDWIADHGALCTSFYATTPVCSPSRAALVSGLYPQKTPVVGNNIPLDESIVTFAELLRRQGYATGFAGKWHLDGQGKPQWAPERKFGFEDNRFMFNRGHWKRLVDTPHGPHVGARDKRGRPNYDVSQADDKSFTTDWLCDKAMDFIKTHRERPFCYMVSLPDPHGPNTVRQPYDTMYANVEVPIPVSLKQTPSQSPKWGQPAGVNAKQLTKLMRQYYGMVKCIDDNVGQILDTLREHDLIDRTVIVFTSDHGDLCGEHGRLNKGVPYEGSARIPFLLYGPGRIQPRTIVNEALTCVDFLPTVMRLLDIEFGHEVDGRDALSLFTGAAGDWDDVAFVRSTPRVPWLSVVNKQYKLVYASNDQPWLIDLKNDPHELTNLFGDDAHAERIRNLTIRLREYARLHNDEYARHPHIQLWMNKVLRSRANDE